MQAKGRNGYFKVAGLDARHSVDGSSVSLELFSRRAANSAPLIIRGTPEEMKSIAGQLLTAIRLAEAHSEPEPGNCKQCGANLIDSRISEYCGAYCEQLAAEGLPSARL